MAKYRILCWKKHPSQVRAYDPGGEVTQLLPDSFQQAIDQAAMQSGEYGTDAYLDGWNWSEEREMPGSAREVLRAVVGELVQGQAGA